MPPPRRDQQPKEQIIRFRLDGKTFTLSRQDIPPKLERELYVQAEVTPAAAFKAVAQGALFGVAAMVWLARRQAGEKITYAKVEETLWAAHQSEDGLELELIDDDDDEVVDDGPPASDAS